LAALIFIKDRLNEAIKECKKSEDPKLKGLANKIDAVLGKGLVFHIGQGVLSPLELAANASWHQESG